MSYLGTRSVGNIIKFLFVVLGVENLKEEKIAKERYVIFSVLYVLGYVFLQGNDSRTYIIQNMYTILMLGICCSKVVCKKNEIVVLTCTLLCFYEVINLVNSILGGVISWLIGPEFYNKENLLLVSLVLKIPLLFIGLICISKIREIILNYGKKICVIYLFTIFIKIPFLFTDVMYKATWKMVFLTIICCTVIFLIISRIDKHNAEKERAKIEENNKKLSSKLHKSQEILPAMVQVLSNVTENGGTEMEEQEAHKLLEEVSDLYGQQLKENSKEDLQLKNFCSTGLKLLDEQLKVYQMEALDRNVNLDIFVQAPINGIMKKDNIDQLKLQRAVGDLIRNAFRVMEREDKKCRAKGHILLIIGCQYEGILEIAVVDNGAEFPLHVIQAFGRRGVTTGGTGNGLADLVEFADETKASIRVDEFAWETSSFTKKISIIFDKQRMNYFNSSRRELIESSFWNNN